MKHIELEKKTEYETHRTEEKKKKTQNWKKKLEYEKGDRVEKVPSNSRQQLKLKYITCKQPMNHLNTKRKRKKRDPENQE
jgi:hypothetical protein